MLRLSTGREIDRQAGTESYIGRFQDSFQVTGLPKSGGLPRGVRQNSCPKVGRYQGPGFWGDPRSPRFGLETRPDILIRGDFLARNTEPGVIAEEDGGQMRVATGL